MTINHLKSFLDSKSDQYNRPEFVPEDPVSIPHLFHKKEDIEIAGFLTTTISWGQRKTIIKNARKLMTIMDDSPFDYRKNSSSEDQKTLLTFVHRTFNGADCQYFVHTLRNIYQNHNGLEQVLSLQIPEAKANLKISLSLLKKKIFELPLSRTTKHLSDPMKGAAAKRMNMFLRWMLRTDDRGVD